MCVDVARLGISKRPQLQQQQRPRKDRSLLKMDIGLDPAFNHRFSAVSAYNQISIYVIAICVDCDLFAAIIVIH